MVNGGLLCSQECPKDTLNVCFVVVVRNPGEKYGWDLDRFHYSGCDMCMERQIVLISIFFSFVSCVKKSEVCVFVFLCFSNKCEYLRVEIVISHSPKEVSNFQVFSGFDSHLRSFFEHHQANDALKYSAIFEENDVYL